MIDAYKVNVGYWDEYNPTSVDLDAFEEMEELYSDLFVENFVQANGFIPAVCARTDLQFGFLMR